MISTHVLDISRGAPAANVDVTLERLDDNGGASPAGKGRTDGDGRAQDLGRVAPGIYRLRFATGAYFAATQRETLYPEVSIVFQIRQSDQRYHLPLLIGPFGYTTYRGS